MGMPACTITSETAHGGVVTVGFPQVLIGMMPASRIGDLHVCPMVTGIVPHVGGPFILGSMTVLVGEMPQSRVTDQLVCVGPPDVAVMGCETVLVGMAGAGGAAGATGGISAMGASVPMQSTTATTSSQPTSELQQDLTVKTSAPAGSSLPPIKLSSPGFPDLPAAQTPNFQSVQPVTLPANTTLYSTAPNPGSYWTPEPPAAPVVTTATVPAEGLKAWMGTSAAHGPFPGGATQVYVPPGTLPIATQSAAKKGIFGEYCADQLMHSLGFEKLNGPTTQIGDSPKGPGIDGVYKNTNPPPQYAIAEAKYGTSKLGNTKSGRQMSPKWVDQRLDKAVGPDQAQEIRDAMLDGGVQRCVINVDQYGRATPTIFGPGEP
jgi:uncharacterized Zn-binding protein involved in type VI secretion